MEQSKKMYRAVVIAMRDLFFIFLNFSALVSLCEKNRKIRVVRKLQFQNNFLIKKAKYGVFCKACERTNRVLEQVHCCFRATRI